MIIALIIIAYLIGSVFAYVFYRYRTKKLFNSWNVSDRKFGLFISLFSYVGVFAVFMSDVFDEDNKPAKW